MTRPLGPILIRAWAAILLMAGIYLALGYTDIDGPQGFTMGLAFAFGTMFFFDWLARRG